MMNQPTPNQCCVFAAWQVISETLVEQVWASICPDHGQMGPEVMLARDPWHRGVQYPVDPEAPTGHTSGIVARVTARPAYRASRAA